jgi:alginate O-acetyltransferase complex protein AlgI
MTEITALNPVWLAALALTPLIFWLAPDRFRDAVLGAGTVLFLAAVAPDSLLILGVFAIATYGLTAGPSVSGPRAWTAGILVIAVLLTYKYLAASSPSVAVSEIIPLGLSFYSIRCLHYIVEKYKNSYAKHDFWAFACYLFFLPTVLAGPIHRFAEFSRDRRRKRWDSALFSEGLERILYGYAKITIVGNFLISNRFAAYIGGLDTANVALIEYLDLLRHGFNLYVQFSGYSDIAIGFALLLGYRVMENFDYPFLKKNISEFWRSWHISLTSWVREHVYMLGILVTRSSVLAVILSMIALGLWHEMSIRYIVWGAYHGLGIAAWQMFQRLKPLAWQARGQFVIHATRAISVFVTFHFVMFGFAIVKEPSLVAALHSIRTIMTFWTR